MKTIIEKYLKTLDEDNTMDNCPDLLFLPKDRRLEDVQYTEMHFKFKHFDTLESWEQRKEFLKDQIKIASGLYPYPEKCPLNPRVFDKKEYGDYFVSKFMIESYPGFYVTGNIFEPKGKKGPFPAILNPHGHWDEGRNEIGEDCSVPARCVNFAKMGIVAVNYDILGYQDSRQVSHGFGKTAENEKWAISGFGLQLWNSIRVLDFVEQMENINKDKIGCTGASGGGTQTFMLAALDDRIKAAVPVNMVSLTMQGGCDCENAPLLRVGTNNLEIVSMLAPRPMLLIGSTGDWTVDLETVDYPAVKSIYDLYGAGKKLEKFYHDAGHNYNLTARIQVYNFFARHLLNENISWKEQPLDFRSDDLRIFKGDEKPVYGIKSNLEMFTLMKEYRIKATEKVWSEDEYGAAQKYKETLKFILNIHDEEILAYDRRLVSMDGYDIERCFIGSEKCGERIPLCFVKKAGIKADKVILILSDDGKYDALSSIKCDTEECVYVSIDMFLTGDYNQPWGKSGRNVPIADFFTAFNYTDDVLMADDILIAVRYLKGIFSDVEIKACGKAEKLAGIIQPFIGGQISATDDKGIFIPCLESIGGTKTCRKISELLI